MGCGGSKRKAPESQHEDQRPEKQEQKKTETDQEQAAKPARSDTKLTGLDQTKELDYDYTLAIIKPDAVLNGDDVKILQMIEASPLKIVARRKVKLTRTAAVAFYSEHFGKPFFEPLVTWMSSFPVHLMILEGENAVLKWRSLMGPTNPATARTEQPQSIRALFGSSVQFNAVHGSDSPRSAIREICYFFPNNGKPLQVIASAPLAPSEQWARILSAHTLPRQGIEVIIIEGEDEGKRVNQFETVVNKWLDDYNDRQQRALPGAHGYILANFPHTLAEAHALKLLFWKRDANVKITDEKHGMDLILESATPAEEGEVAPVLAQLRVQGQERGKSVIHHKLNPAEDNQGKLEELALSLIENYTAIRPHDVTPVNESLSTPQLCTLFGLPEGMSIPTEQHYCVTGGGVGPSGEWVPIISGVVQIARFTIPATIIDQEPAAEEQSLKTPSSLEAKQSSMEPQAEEPYYPHIVGGVLSRSGGYVPICGSMVRAPILSHQHSPPPPESPGMTSGSDAPRAKTGPTGVVQPTLQAQMVLQS
eukprot:GCRY01008286.1.p1 GENE.GCRY01008286.1~~GCRY01008286.1.p1  ORF type:complete len:535 (-),score=113.27 GCRY01008286.1:244-1848(-)